MSSDIPLPYDFVENPLKKAEVNWKYGLKEYEPEHIQICPATFRPLSKVDGKNWESVAQKNYKMSPEELFSGRKYFQAFLQKYGVFPSRDELILFFYNRLVVHGKSSTLPYLTSAWAKQILSEYKELMSAEKVNVKEVVKRMKNSTFRVTRQGMEQGT